MAAGEAGDWNSTLIPHSALLYITVALIGVTAGGSACRERPVHGWVGLGSRSTLAPKRAGDDEHLFGVHDFKWRTLFYGHHHRRLHSLRAGL